MYSKNATVKDGSGSYWMNTTSYPQIKNNAGVNTDYIAMAKGDVLEMLLVYYNGNYEAYLSNRSS